MNNGRRRGGGNRGNTRGESVRDSLARLKSELRGHANELRHIAPPQFTLRPYNNLTAEYILDGSTATDGAHTFRIADLMKTVQSQLCLAPWKPGTNPGDIGTNYLSIKLHRLDVFAPPNDNVTGPVTLKGVFYSLQPNVPNDPQGQHGQQSLKSLESHGLKGAKTAVISYTWPDAEQQLPLDSTAGLGTTAGDIAIIDTIRSDKKLNLTFRFHVHWNTQRVVKPADPSAFARRQDNIYPSLAGVAPELLANGPRY